VRDSPEPSFALVPGFSFEILLLGMTRFLIKSMEVSQTIDQKAALTGLGKHYPVIWTDPLTIALSLKRKQYLVLTPYGVIALTNVSGPLEEKALYLIKPFLQNPVPEIVNFDEIKVVTDPNQKIRVLFDKIILPSLEEKFLLIICMLLCQSVGLESFEKRVDPLLEQLSSEISKFSRIGFFPKTSILKKSITQIMLLHQELVSSLGILDKPDLTWEKSDWDFLYTQFAESLELRERTEILSEKIKLLQDNIRTALDMIATHRIELLELAIVALFLLEIILFTIGEAIK